MTKKQSKVALGPKQAKYAMEAVAMEFDSMVEQYFDLKGLGSLNEEDKGNYLKHLKALRGVYATLNGGKPTEYTRYMAKVIEAVAE